MTQRHADTNLIDALRNISVQDFMNFGVRQIAYIRTHHAQDQRKSYAIYSADGKQLSVMNSMEEAIVAARYNDLEPVTVH